MRRLVHSLCITFLLVVATLLAMQVARGQGPGDAAPLSRETQGVNVRESYGSVQAASQRAPGTDAPRLPISETQGDNRREITAAAEGDIQPALIGFIDTPSCVCYQPDPRQDVCFINWYYMSVNAAPNYMITMTVALNSIGIVSRVSGFFQTSMYTPYNMYGNGFKVPCGAPGAGGNPELGNAYSWTIRARDSANLGSANYGTVHCPAYRR